MLESEPHRRLAYTWHSFTPELAKHIELTDELAQRVAASPARR